MSWPVLPPFPPPASACSARPQPQIVERAPRSPISYILQLAGRSRGLVWSRLGWCEVVQSGRDGEQKLTRVHLFLCPFPLQHHPEGRCRCSPGCHYRRARREYRPTLFARLSSAEAGAAWSERVGKLTFIQQPVLPPPIEPGCRDCRLPDHQAPGLCHPRSPNCQYVHLPCCRSRPVLAFSWADGPDQSRSFRARVSSSSLRFPLPPVSNLHKETKKTFSHVIRDLYEYVNPKNNRASPMISEATFNSVMKNADLLDSAVIYDRDFHYNLSVLKTACYLISLI